MATFTYQGKEIEFRLDVAAAIRSEMLGTRILDVMNRAQLEDGGVPFSVADLDNILRATGDIGLQALLDEGLGLAEVGELIGKIISDSSFFKARDATQSSAGSRPVGRNKKG